MLVDNEIYLLLVEISHFSSNANIFRAVHMISASAVGNKVFIGAWLSKFHKKKPEKALSNHRWKRNILSIRSKIWARTRDWQYCHESWLQNTITHITPREFMSHFCLLWKNINHSLDKSIDFDCSDVFSLANYCNIF